MYFVLNWMLSLCIKLWKEQIKRNGNITSASLTDIVRFVTFWNYTVCGLLVFILPECRNPVHSMSSSWTCGCFISMGNSYICMLASVFTDTKLNTTQMKHYQSVDFLVFTRKNYMLYFCLNYIVYIKNDHTYCTRWGNVLWISKGNTLLWKYHIYFWFKIYNHQKLK